VDWFHAKRQLLGVVIRQGGRCTEEVARQLIQPSEGATLEQVFEQGSKYNLSKVLFWEPSRVFRRREVLPELAAAAPPEVTEELRHAIAQAVKSSGSATLSELKAAVEAANLGIEVDGQLVHTAAQVTPELFFVPGHVFLRHVANSMITQDAVVEEPEEPVDEEEAFMRAGLAEVAAAAAAIEEPQTEAPEGLQAEGAGATSGFFTFGGFAPRQVVHDPSPPQKRQKLATGSGFFGEQAPAWITEGAAVKVARGQAHLTGAIVDIRGDICVVRLEVPTGGATEVVEEQFPLPALLPVEPQAGSSVKVVGGDRTGCFGKLVGLAGSEGVVQIGGMSYVTLPMSQIAVLAA